MKKSIAKKILQKLDLLELHLLNIEEAFEPIKEMLEEEQQSIEDEKIIHFLNMLEKHHMIVIKDNYVDLSPTITIYARSIHSSTCEALALFECLLHDASIKEQLVNLLFKDTIYTINELQDVFDDFTLSFLLQTSLFLPQHQRYELNQVLFIDLERILEEYEKEAPYVTSILCAYYIAQQVNMEDPSIEFKNEDYEMVPYDQIDDILEIAPRFGVTSDREEGRHLQAFYKDTLFHESEHRCFMCGNDIPEMLIASHIKPHRDCAHMIEVSDYHNGILLCRNHDYLFDQGHFSFDQNAKILISPYIKKKDNYQSTYQLQDDIILSNHLNNKQRMRFLAYHASYIFKNE